MRAYASAATGKRQPNFLPVANEVRACISVVLKRKSAAKNSTLETGKLAKQAHGAVVVGLGETLTLTAACEGPPDPGTRFLPAHGRLP